MKLLINTKTKKLKRVLSFLIIAVIIGSTGQLQAQAELYGPENPPPKISSIISSHPEGSGQIGRAGGLIYTITNITLANSTTVYWSTLDNSVKLSMDGSTYTGGENMIIDPAQTNLAGGVITWKGSTQMPLAAGGYTQLLSKFIMTVYDLSNNPVPLVDPSITGLPAGSGGAVLVTGSTMVFKVRLEMFVSANGGVTYVPHLDYYDPAPTPPGAVSAYSTYNYGFYWENDPPELVTNLGISVDEGGSAPINNVVFVATDVESSQEQLKIILDPKSESLLPAYGKLQYSGSDMALPDTVSMADIFGDLLTYIHNGSESVKDSIPFLVFDSDGEPYKEGLDSVFYISIEITPVDDPPTVSIIAGVDMNEGEKVVITEEMLLTTDPESTSDLITYTLDPASDSEYPVNGVLKLSDIPLSDGSTFTQKDIADGKLAYTHSGTQTMTDGFKFRVADEFGHLADNNGSPDWFFNITITPTNDPPVFSKNIPLEVVEGASAVISNSFIGAMDEESGPEDILFTIDPDLNIPDPLYGQILLDGTELGHGDSFTMADVNNTLVIYQHDDSETSNDFIPLGISDPDGGVAMDGEYSVFHFNIIILPENDPPTVENPIEDQEARAESPYNFTVPENTFADKDPGDSFTFDSYLDDESPLPSWLDFDGQSRTFSGTPPLAEFGQIYVIIVEAKDTEEAKATDIFLLEVTSPVKIRTENSRSGIQIYPNPFTDMIRVSLSDSFVSEVNIEILNMLGEQIIERVEKPGAELDLDLSTHSSGLYFIRIADSKKVYTKRIMKR